MSYIQKMSPTGGTPKTLDELVEGQLMVIMSAPKDKVRETLCQIVRDYMANKFAPSYLKTDDLDELKKIQDLFERLTRRDVA